MLEQEGGYLKKLKEVNKTRQLHKNATDKIFKIYEALICMPEKELQK